MGKGGKKENQHRKKPLGKENAGRKLVSEQRGRKIRDNDRAG